MLSSAGCACTVQTGMRSTPNIAGNFGKERKLHFIKIKLRSQRKYPQFPSTLNSEISVRIMYYARKPATLTKIRKTYGKTVQVDGFATHQGTEHNAPRSVGTPGAVGTEHDTPRATGTPGAVGTEHDAPRSVGTPGAVGTEHDTPRSVGTPGAVGTEHDTPRSVGTPGAVGTEHDTPRSVGTPGAVGTEHDTPCRPSSFLQCTCRWREIVRLPSMSHCHWIGAKH